MTGYVYRGDPQGENAPVVPAERRIIFSAVELYGERGFSEVSLKQIAAAAGVSAPLIIHHFGSKDGLRIACDKHVAEIVRDFKNEAVQAGNHFSLELMFTRVEQTQPVMRYLVQSLMIGGDEINAVMDELLEDAIAYTTDGVAKGLIKPATNERRRAALLLIHGVGSMVLHRQMKRYLGVSLLDDSPTDFGDYIATVMEVYTNGVIEPEAFSKLHAEEPEPVEEK